MSTHKAIHVESAGAEFALADVETTSPPADHVRITVAACGVCGTDQGFINGGFPGMTWPLTPGHEIAGTIAELGDGVEGFTVGDRVAVGWFGGNCNKCVPCRKGKFMQCEKGQVPSWQYPGGYAESIVVPATALARIPDGLSFAEAAPLGCAGVTTFNALRKSAAEPGDLVAVLGIGGLGHLGVQWARAMGFETVAIARGSDKAADAKELGAHHYIDSKAVEVARRAARSRRRDRRARDGGERRRDRPDRRRPRSRGPAHRRRGLGRPDADQPAGPDHLRAQRDRASVGHVAGRGGDDALRRAMRRPALHRGNAVGPRRPRPMPRWTDGRARYRKVLTM